MNIYNWESNPRAHQKKAKKAGTVVFHPQGDLDTSFARFLKPQAVPRANPFGVDGDREEHEEDEGGEHSTARPADNSTKKKELLSSLEEGVEEEMGEEHRLSHHQSFPMIPLMTATTMQRLRDVFGFTQLLPSQAQCYKGIFLRRDVILHSRTGSGKTLAYALPIVERYLLFKAKMKAMYPDEPFYQDEEDAKEKDAEVKTKGKNDLTANPSKGPFLLIFVFSVDLAVQTKMVLSKLYPQLRIEAVPCYKEKTGITTAETQDKEAEKEKSGRKKVEATISGSFQKGVKDKRELAEVSIPGLERADILVGTVHGIDSVIRGHRIAAEALQEEEKEYAPQVASKRTGRSERHQKRRRGGEATKQEAKEAPKKKNKTEKKRNHHGRTLSDLKEIQEEQTEEEEDSGSEDETEELDEKEDKGVPAVGTYRAPSTRPAEFEGGVVSAARVQAIVVDEVDTTLGPRFSSLGRRMKNLLKFIRKSNGALNPELLTDYRAHHYVLCGATIPNWVIKAGFLGIKKYYYRLVQPGTQKLPKQLSCYYIPCPLSLFSRVSKVQELLRESRTAAKGKQKNVLDTSSSSQTASANPFLGRVVVFGSNKEIESVSSALSSSSPTKTNDSVVFTLTARLPEAERIAAIAGFNDSTNLCATLLCTDIASRGLDVFGADTILMMSLPLGPMAVETFIHRAGRTARVDRIGRCIILLAEAAGPSNGGGSSSTTVARSSSHSGFHYNADEERDSYDRIVQAAHITFQHFGATLGGNAKQRARLQLEVRRPFLGTPRSGTPTLPTAKEVLEKELASSVPAAESSGESLRELVEDIREDESKPSEKIFFSAPTSMLHMIKKKLWKYDLKEI